MVLITSIFAPTGNSQSLIYFRLPLQNSSIFCNCSFSPDPSIDNKCPEYSFGLFRGKTGMYEPCTEVLTTSQLFNSFQLTPDLLPCKIAHLRCLTCISVKPRKSAVRDNISSPVFLLLLLMFTSSTYPNPVGFVSSVANDWIPLNHLSIPCSNNITDHGSPWMIPFLCTTMSLNP